MLETLKIVSPRGLHTFYRSVLQVNLSALETIRFSSADVIIGRHITCPEFPRKLAARMEDHRLVVMLLAVKAKVAYFRFPKFHSSRCVHKQIVSKAGNQIENKAYINIPNKLIKVASRPLSIPFTEIYNESISSGEVPDIFKISRITPVYKSGPVTELGNYRPIAGGARNEMFSHCSNRNNKT